MKIAKINNAKIKQNIPKNISFKANKMPKQEAQFLKEKLTQNPNVDIFTHESTDKDALNSALCVSNYLERFNIKPRIIVSGDLNSLDILDTTKTIVDSKDYEPKDDKTTFLCVDFSATERISPKIYTKISSSPYLYCIDHHKNPTLPIETLELEEPKDTSRISKTAPSYVDSSAKSATSIIFRFFEALEEEIDDKTALEMFYGLVSDCFKKDFVQVDGKKGEIEATEKLKEDKNAYEIFEALEKKLNKDQLKRMAQNIDIMGNLSEEEENFYQSLFSKIQYSKSRKTAFVALSPDDEEWKKLGEDNQRTSTILNSFRQELLKNNDLDNAIVFYKAEGNYRLSVHSNKNLEVFYKKAQEEIKEEGFSIGGHKERGGGKIATLDQEKCQKFVQKIIEIIG